MNEGLADKVHKQGKAHSTTLLHFTQPFLAPSIFPAKKAQAVSFSYAQSKAQMDHSKRLLTAIANAKRIALWH